MCTVKLGFSLLLITIIVSIIKIEGLVKFKLPKTDIVHPKSGLVLHYLNEYRPANKISTFSVSIPMYSDMCYLVPSLAMGKISECLEKESTMREIKVLKAELIYNDKIVLKNSSETNRRKTKSLDMLNKDIMKHGTTKNIKTTTQPPLGSPEKAKEFLIKNRLRVGDKETIYVFSDEQEITKPSRSMTRQKRFLPAIIAIGAGIASAAISAVNTAQLTNLKSEMRGVKESLQVLHLSTLDNQAQILHLNEGALRLTQELVETQTALNKTMQLVNQHSDILRLHTKSLREMMTQTTLLRDKLATTTQAMESHFIHESIENILANRLNLHFIHHEDMGRVVRLISDTLDLSVNDFNSSIPMIEIITRLLVRQQIDFAPKIAQDGPNNGIIGKLIFTSYFAAADHDQAPFSIYQLVPLPFKANNKRMILARMPTYLGIEHISQHFIRWTKEESTTCDFDVMPSCRETPIKRKESEDDCIYQILTDSVLKDCRTEPFSDKVFIHRVGQYWAISTYNKSKCHAVLNEDLEQHVLIDNDEVTIPEIALITTNNERILACDKFIIPKTPVLVGTPINIIYNESVQPIDKTLIDLQEALDNDTHWLKLPYISSDIQAVLEFMNNTPKPIIDNNNLKIWYNHPTISLVKITMLGVMFLVLIILIFYVFRLKKSTGSNTNVTIAMPTMKELLAREE